MLYIVATPIGNLEDITLRALRVLKEVDLIAAEDTRQTRKLLSRYDIDTELTSCHEHNERSKIGPLVDRLESGQSVAIVSDAGTPTISDPGYHLVREAIRRDIPVTSIPGASALTVAMSASGLATDRFVFEGFLPAKRGPRRSAIEARKSERGTLVYYEAPHRIKDTLTDICEILGDRQAVLARELSKIHEEFLRGPVSRLLTDLAPSRVRGEFVIMVAGCPEQRDYTPEELIVDIQGLLQSGSKATEIAKALAKSYPLPKREIYKKVIEAMSCSRRSEGS